MRIETETTANNKRIAKNTILLYLRMIVILVVNLYTSKVIINSLGFSDYGIYTVVGGIVTMLQFLNVGMSGASQRFISYGLGKANINTLRKTLCTSLITHYIIALIAVIVMESVGLWFLNFKMNIPAERLIAANWVFQFSIITFALSVISVPYNATIIAHERMNTFAYITIIEAIAKFAIAFAIVYSHLDRLVLYAFLILIIQGAIRIIYIVYCKKHFEECSFKYQYDKSLFKKMFKFAGWGCVGNMGFSTKDQLSNIILNLFFDTTINAARGIATQVSGIVSLFASNFTMAMNPQITKLYASGNIEKSRDLAYAGSKYAFLLLSLITIPFLINEHYLMTLWLGNIPPYTDAFLFILLIGSLIYAMAHTTATAIMATGEVKWLQLGLAIILLSEVPIAYIVLILGGNPWQAMIPSIITTFISVLYRFYLITKYVPAYSFKKYITGTVFPCFIIFILSMGLSSFIRSLFSEGFCNFVLTSGVSFAIVLLFSYILGLSRKERKFVLNKTNSVLRSICK